MIPEADPHLSAYLNEILRTNKPEQQSITFWFPTHKNLGKIEDPPQYNHASSVNCVN